MVALTMELFKVGKSQYCVCDVAFTTFLLHNKVSICDVPKSSYVLTLS